MNSQQPIFGSKDSPLRASLLPNLFQCSHGFVRKTLEDKSKQAEPGDVNADTGNLIHAGIQEFHICGSNLVAGVNAIAASRDKFPAGDAKEAERLYNFYVRRERSEAVGVVIKSEWRCRVVLPAAEVDPTKEEIVIDGTVDQIRQIGDWYYVVDHKTGWKSGEELIRDYAAQQACYLVGVANAFSNRNVRGFIGRIKSLTRSNLQYYWELPFDYDLAMATLDTVRGKVALIRAGMRMAEPGKHCDWCPYSKHAECLKGVMKSKEKIRKPNNDGLATLDDLFGGK